MATKRNYPKWSNYYSPYSGILADKILGNIQATDTLAAVAASQAVRPQTISPPIASRVLIVGPPASGKSELINAVVGLLQLPTVYANCSTLAPPSYKGSDIQNAIRTLILEAGLGGAQRASSGSIIVLDEIDKIQRREDAEISKQIEYSLLPVLSSEKILIEPNDQDAGHEHFSSFDSLVLMAGVFPGIAKSAWANPIRARKALIRYGFCEEFVSRISHIVQLDQPSPKILYKIIEREAEKLSNLYQSFDQRPALTPREVKALVCSPILSSLGVRSIRMDIHNMLQQKAYKKVMVGR